MAKLSAVLDHGLAGGKIGKSEWSKNFFISFFEGKWMCSNGIRFAFDATWADDDWEVYAEPATNEEIAAYFERVAAEYPEYTNGYSVYRVCAEIVRTRRIPEGT